MIQVYTGNGKGKTTAALGLAIRGAGAGLKVFIAQFMKGRNCSELKALKRIKNIEFAQFGRGCFVVGKPTKKDIECVKKGFKKMSAILAKKKYDMLILDEINIVVKLGLLGVEEVVTFLQNVPNGLELVLTGRDAHPEILKLADLVSEIKVVRHYYQKGLKARRGIEF